MRPKRETLILADFRRLPVTVTARKLKHGSTTQVHAGCHCCPRNPKTQLSRDPKRQNGTPTASGCIDVPVVRSRFVSYSRHNTGTCCAVSVGSFRQKFLFPRSLVNCKRYRAPASAAGVHRRWVGRGVVKIYKAHRPLLSRTSWLSVGLN